MDNRDSIIYTNIIPNKLKYHSLYKYHNNYNLNCNLYFYSPSESISNNIWNNILNATSIDSVKIYLSLIRNNVLDTGIRVGDKIQATLVMDEKLNIQLTNNKGGIGANIHQLNKASMFEKSLYNINLHSGMELVSINNTDTTNTHFTEISKILESTPRPIYLQFMHTNVSFQKLTLSNKIQSHLLEGYCYNNRINVLHLNYSHDTLFEYIALKFNIYIKIGENISCSTCEKVYHHGTHPSTLNYANYIKNKNVQYGVINIDTHNINMGVVLELLKYISDEQFIILYKNFEDSNVGTIFNNSGILALAFEKPSINEPS